MALFTRRVTSYLLVFLAVFLVGTIAFLSTVNAYFSIASSAYITTDELGTWEEIRYGASDLQSKDALNFAQNHPLLAKFFNPLSPSITTNSDSSQVVGKSGFVEGRPNDLVASNGNGEEKVYSPLRDNSPKKADKNSPPEQIPRIIHQTWKDEVLPPRWKAVRDECAAMHPDYEYKLWTDASSRQFLVDHYPWFLPIFDNYPYPIQKADAIRYFVLHYYGGIYMDLDIGCLRRLDPLLRFEVVLPKTIPVGVSNDLLLSAPGHPFMDQLIHTLVTFNHQYLTHYPTVMFSTGPMFVSASYGIFTSAQGSAAPSSTKAPALGFKGIRILPKSLYGKNAKPGEAPDAFFSHYYGSSWHANDAGFLIFLRDHGRFMMFIGGLVVAYGALRVIAPRVLGAGSGGSRRRRSAPGRWISLAVSGSSSSRRSTSGSRHGHKSRSSRNNEEMNMSRRGAQDEDDEDFSVPANSSISRDGEEERFLSPSAPSTSRGPRSMAAPKPQRLSLPLFELQEDQETENLDSPRDSEGGIGASSLLAWVGSSLSRPSSRNDSFSNATTTSPSPHKKKSSTSSGTLYLPAYFVNNQKNNSRDDDSSSSTLSPSSSPSISTNGGSGMNNGSWGPHSRRASAGATALGNWASGLLPNGWRTPSPSVSFKSGGGIVGGRTPSPTGEVDLESIGNSSSDTEGKKSSNGGGRFAGSWKGSNSNLASSNSQSNAPNTTNETTAYSAGPFNGAGAGKSYSIHPGTSTAASPPPNEAQQFSSMSMGLPGQISKSPALHRNVSATSSSFSGLGMPSGTTTPVGNGSQSIAGGAGRLVRRTSNQNLNSSHLTSVSISDPANLSPSQEEPSPVNNPSDLAPPPPYVDTNLVSGDQVEEKR